jgi:hypothetical protein
MSITVTVTITNDEIAAPASATGPAQSEPPAARHTKAAVKTTRALLAEHESEIDAEIARRRSSSCPNNGGTP